MLFPQHLGKTLFSLYINRNFSQFQIPNSRCMMKKKKRAIYISDIKLVRIYKICS